MEYQALTNQILAPMTVLGQILIILAILYFFVLKKRDERIVAFVKKYALLTAFLIATAAMLGSLVYSEVIGYEPCVLCWYQRVFMYPQVLLLWMGMYRKDGSVKDYVLALSAIGAIIAFYHYMLQIGAAPSVVCSAVGYSVDCAQNFTMQLGYITLPMMSLTAFLMVAVLMLILKKLSSK
jgi:disulfide bond formation protein DsbB